jgi:hypothetical protein
LNYVLRNWGGYDLPAHTRDFTAAEVHELRGINVDDVAALRRRLAAELLRQGISVNY